MPTKNDNAETRKFAAALADQLGETAPGPRYQVARVVSEMGMDFARELYQLTLEAEAPSVTYLRIARYNPQVGANHISFT